jgi:hemerythrin
MSLIYWDDSFSVKVAEIDLQHKKLFEIINRLNDQIQQSSNKEIITTIIKELEDYADYHFSTEEKYIEEFHCSDTDVHLAAHREYTSRIQKYADQYNTSQSLDLKEILRFLVAWWIGHITQMDHKYVQCFVDHGLT